ncbi:MAG: DNA primase [Nitrospirae bacterium CG_4_10_14_3_um_filter_44_29]|nr:DNA primase [Nitrospirota bacterium]OIO27775.1 MAG: DNA primase [Nitrospirae bacterium CG1_02_44_142]PIP69799.1 MAG: DNA primase [Nitrospirae bacterium CG22_combo_CG10-13_8_21_14_all_44_11]PIV42680.1 MAG: DNA primase [Nitrospirae bacterium CG02_land_8_20_14_3_00_44_33]PIV65495.1 MAG: DNA primase [Nitrospirae bacterium CG01_land_8_20_14_3_00_44_22]PIW89047.1 MAG: DNA primase [Nitrospirae bacterium CG_4_8_14_3_um_filter_44_28]PIX87971.1 MAG: DNA primase [Nitrospirae bacterium CG_4_10_14_3_um
MKTDRILDDIKSRIDIVELVSDYIELKKAGQNYRAACPFHAEKTPSFMVSQSKQIFHCFGCGAGGDIFGFVMKYENLNFQEALKMLAKKAGVQLSGFRFDDSLTERKERLYVIQKEALNTFTGNLKKSKTAIAYLDNRGVSLEMVEAFSLGYADRGRKVLYDHLKANGFDDSLITQSGLVFTGESGLHDVFKNRIMFPIFNIQGDAVAFGGRAVDDSMPKYLNSPETLLFKKGETLYGLNAAKDEIRKKGYVMIVEGYLDVIMCCQHGFLNVAAPLGTALTAGHLKKLGRFTKKVLIVFDSDAAGIAAAKRSLSILYEHGFTSKVLLLPEGDDPDSFLRENGSRAFQIKLSKTESMVDFILRLKGDKSDNVRTAIGIIDNAKDLILREELFKELAEKSGIREAVLRGETKRYEQRAGTAKAAGVSKTAGFFYDEEVLLLSAIVAFPDRAPHIFANLNIDRVRNPIVRQIFQEIKPLGERLNMNTMLGILNDEGKALITRLSLNPGFDLEYVDKNIRDCMRGVTYCALEERIREAQKIGDQKLLRALLIEKQEIKNPHREENG